MEGRIPGLERKACERCRRLKCKCDNNSPCASCASQNTECVRLMRRRPVRIERKDNRCLVHCQNKVSYRSLLKKESDDVVNYDFDSFFGYNDLQKPLYGGDILPDMNLLLHDLFSALNRPRPNELNFTNSCSLHRLLSSKTSISLNRLDPLEFHRMTIIEHLSQSGQVGADDISWFTSTNLRHSLIAYFRHCHRHLPIIHLPTWDIATIPSPLVLVQALLGSLYIHPPAANGLRARRLISEAFALIFNQDEVNIFLYSADEGISQR